MAPSPTVPIRDVSSLLWGAVTWVGTWDREQDPASHSAELKEPPGLFFPCGCCHTDTPTSSPHVLPSRPPTPSPPELCRVGGCHRDTSEQQEPRQSSGELGPPTRATGTGGLVAPWVTRGCGKSPSQEDGGS